MHQLVTLYEMPVQDDCIIVDSKRDCGGNANKRGGCRG